MDCEKHRSWARDLRACQLCQTEELQSKLRSGLDLLAEMVAQARRMANCVPHDGMSEEDMAKALTEASHDFDILRELAVLARDRMSGTEPVVEIRCGNANCDALLSAGEPHVEGCLGGDVENPSEPREWNCERHGKFVSAWNRCPSCAVERRVTLPEGCHRSHPHGTCTKFCV